MCVALPKRDSKLCEILSESFEVTDATEWDIGKATYGIRDRDSSYLVTDGGCSCFILGMNHGCGEAKVETVENFIKALLQRTPCVSILIHDTRGDIARENVICKYKSRVSFSDFVRQFPSLQQDVRYLITN